MTHETYEVIRLTPRHLAKQDLGPILKLFAAKGEKQDTISRLAGKLFLDLDDLLKPGAGTTNDPVFRAYFQALDRELPHLPLFLARSPEAGQLLLYTSFLVDHEPEGDHLRFDKPQLERFALNKVRAIHEFCQEQKLDARPAIRAFCKELNLEVLEELESGKPQYPFEPERITSEFLIHFFEHGYHFHTIDSSDEPVLFALVDDPARAYYAQTALELKLFRSTSFPVIHLEFTVFDEPENPLTMSFLYNVEQAKHRQELAAYAEMAYLTSNFLFKSEGELFYGFSRAVELPESLRAQIPRLMQQAQGLLRAIPKEARDFQAAVEELFAKGGEEAAPPPKEEPKPKPTPKPVLPARNLAELIEEEPMPAAPKKGKGRAQQVELPIASPRHALAKEEPPVASEVKVESKAEPEPVQSRTAEAPEPQEPYEPSAARAEILDEYDLEEAEAGEAEKSDDPETSAEAEAKPYVRVIENPIPPNILPENIQRITRALSKPVRRPDKAITDELTVKPAPKRVALRDEDQLERLSRRLLITQSKLETCERENLRLQTELKTARDEVEKLQRENLDMESRWWKFWK